MRPIDADSLPAHFDANYVWVQRYAWDNAPTLDVRPNIHGEWLVPYLHCSVCGGQSLTKTTFCGHCGAKMDGVNEGL